MSSTDCIATYVPTLAEQLGLKVDQISGILVNLPVPGPYEVRDLITDIRRLDPTMSDDLIDKRIIQSIELRGSAGTKFFTDEVRQSILHASYLPLAK